MVNLTRIYTRTGDDGTTALGDLSRTSKTDVRLAAYADVNEANAAIGVAVACGDLPEDVRAVLVRALSFLFTLWLLAVCQLCSGADVKASVAMMILPGPAVPSGAIGGRIP